MWRFVLGLGVYQTTVSIVADDDDNLTNPALELRNGCAAVTGHGRVVGEIQKRGSEVPHNVEVACGGGEGQNHRWFVDEGERLRVQLVEQTAPPAI